MKYGNIEGIKVGQLFDSRKELAEAGVHAPTMAGIWGRENEGACSIVLSGGYEDDIDQLDYIQYTGQGGQENGKQILLIFQKECISLIERKYLKINRS